ncbi:hypothetical protein [Candidatus Deianiraea vastatrix]|uniref:Uncharacterized protein n=1 Tax=Candidatus Deianiraea vastatrix TaxID=2163644 RepID=A0A5B8XEZ6_9RICK|nr:hypothetical protein [Candidatus Deianiraea vastatrix]QED23546.1 hypothetical protein Deia_00756 [Candidatus Deianiraea vastatrix]
MSAIKFALFLTLISNIANASDYPGDIQLQTIKNQSKYQTINHEITLEKNETTLAPKDKDPNEMNSIECIKMKFFLIEKFGFLKIINEKHNECEFLVVYKDMNISIKRQNNANTVNVMQKDENGIARKNDQMSANILKQINHFLDNNKK